jgi:hypothetical protein
LGALILDDGNLWDSDAEGAAAVGLNCEAQQGLGFEPLKYETIGKDRLPVAE